MFGAVLAGSMGQERTSSEPPPAREQAAQTRERGIVRGIPSILSLIRAGNSNAHSEERSTYVGALHYYANGRTTSRPPYSASMPFPIICRRGRRCHVSRDKVQPEVYDVVTDTRPRLVALLPLARETRKNTVLPHHLIHPYLVSCIECVGARLDNRSGGKQCSQPTSN